MNRSPEIQPNPTPGFQPDVVGGQTPHATPYNRELGRSTARTITAIGAAVVCVIGAPVSCLTGIYHRSNDVLSALKPKTVFSPEGSTAKAMILDMRPEPITCIDVQLADATGSTIRFEEKVFDKVIPQYGSNATAEALLFTTRNCDTEEANAIAQSVKIQKGDSATNAKYVPVTVTIPTDGFRKIVSPVQGSKLITVTHDVAKTAILGGRDGAKASATVACNVITLGQKQPECENFARRLTGNRAGYEGLLLANGEQLILEAVSRQCTNKTLPDTLGMYADQILDQAVRLANNDPEAAKAVTIVFTRDGKAIESVAGIELPNADADILKNAGVNRIVNDENMGIDLSSLKASCTASRHYPPKYPQTAQIMNGLSQPVRTAR